MAPCRTDHIDWTLVANSTEFQKVCAGDPTLDRLEEEMRNPEAECRDLTYLLGASSVIELGGQPVPVPVPAPGHIALWYLARSPLLLPSRQWDDHAGLTALYILLKGNQAPVDHPNILHETVTAYFADFAGIDREQLRSDLQDMLRDAWHPYVLLPHPEDSGEPPENRQDPVYGADWLSALVARVAAVTNLTPDRIIWDMPMSVAASYDVQYCRYVIRQQHIARRPENVAAMKAYWDRIYELAKTFQDS